MNASSKFPVVFTVDLNKVIEMCSRSVYFSSTYLIDLSISILMSGSRLELVRNM